MKYWWIAVFGLVLTMGCQPPTTSDGAGPEPLDDSNETSSVVRVADVKSFSIPEDAGAWIAYLLEEPVADDSEEADDTGREEAGDDDQAAQSRQHFFAERTGDQ